jgi:long-chain acyl-CoA synthetase
MKSLPAGQQPVGVVALPLYRIFAVTVNMMLGMRQGGKGILIPNPRDLAAVLKELAQHKIHAFPAVNTLFNGLANHPDFNTVDWSHLKISVGGGMAVQGAVADLWLKKTGCSICEGYGLSETSPSVTCNPTDSQAYSGTIGLPIPGTDLKCLDDDDNKVPLGQPGEIAIKSSSACYCSFYHDHRHHQRLARRASRAGRFATASRAAHSQASLTTAWPHS